MSGSLDSCISNIYEPGNIPASAGTPPVRVLLKDPIEVLVLEAAIALDTPGLQLPIDVIVSETATATAAQDAATVAAPLREAVLDGVFVDPKVPKTLIGTDVPDSGPIIVV